MRPRKIIVNLSFRPIEDRWAIDDSPDFVGSFVDMNDRARNAVRIIVQSKLSKSKLTRNEIQRAAEAIAEVGINFSFTENFDSLTREDKELFKSAKAIQNAIALGNAIMSDQGTSYCFYAGDLPAFIYPKLKEILEANGCEMFLRNSHSIMPV